jgi:hypothetical protein
MVIRCPTFEARAIMCPHERRQDLNGHRAWISDPAPHRTPSLSQLGAERETPLSINVANDALVSTATLGKPQGQPPVLVLDSLVLRVPA